MPNVPIAIDESKAEPITKTRMSINAELKSLTPGKAVLGYVGQGRIDKEEQPEVLNDKEKADKKKLQGMIVKHIRPPVLSESKPNPDKDKSSFLKKVERQSLGELRRFWGGKIPDELTEDEIVELNRRWVDISP